MMKHSGYIVAALLCLMVACQTRDTDRRDTGSDGRGYAAVLAAARQARFSEGSHGGTLQLGVTAEAATLNPLCAADNASADVATLLFEGLLRFDDTRNELSGALARSWELADDGMSAVVSLKPGLQWSDGTAIRADDVVYTLQIAAGAAAGALSGAAALLQVCGGAVAAERLDSLSVRITLSQPCALLGRALTMPILAAHSGAGTSLSRAFHQQYRLRMDMRTLPVNGPFMPAAWIPGRRMVLVRNPRYHATSAAGAPLPYLDSVVVSVVRDHNTQMVRFQRGEIHVFCASGNDYALLARDSARSYHLHCMGPSRTATTLLFNQNAGRDSAGALFVDSLKQTWFGDRWFRRAVAHALHREAIMDGARVKGFAQYGPVHPADSSILRYPQARYGYDTLLSRRTLREAGFVWRDRDGALLDAAGNVVAFSLLVAAENLARRNAAAQIAEDLGRIGMRVTVQAVDYQSVLRMLDRAPYDWDAALLGLSIASEPLDAWELWHSAGRRHVWHPFAPSLGLQGRIDSLLSVALREPAAPRRAALYREWQEVFAQHLPVIPVYAPERIVCVSSRFGNAYPAIQGGMLRSIAQVYYLPPERQDAGSD